MLLVVRTLSSKVVRFKDTSLLGYATPFCFNYQEVIPQPIGYDEVIQELKFVSCS